MSDHEYVLITSARNEENYIEKTILAVIQQTLLPKRWIIVSDGSTDQTDEIVKNYAQRYTFIHFVHKNTQRERDFSSKVFALQTGLAFLSGISYDFLGNLDADVSFESNYYETILERFQKNNNLGIAGGVIYDYYKGSFYNQMANPNSISGSVQMFRRQCFEQVGGYLPLKFGNEDGVAEVTARMYGWKTLSFSDIKVLHWKDTGTAGRNIWKTKWSEGKKEFLTGYHPLFYLARSFRLIAKRPILFGSLLRIISYCYHYLKSPKRSVSEKFIQYLRWEQKKKLRKFFYFDLIEKQKH